MKKTIICVDDEKIVLDSLKNELKNHLNNEYTIETAESGDEALSLVDELIEDKSEIPLIIADYIMPNMKGDEVLISVHKKLPETKTIMLTGQATMEGVTSAVNNAGLYRYIPKPWEAEDLILTIKEALKIYEAEKKLEERRKELEVANKKLTALDRSKTYFIKLLAHELKTPLQAITGFTDILKVSIEDPELQGFCNDIDESAKRLQKFTDYSLLILELLNERYNIKIGKQNMNNLIHDAIDNLSLHKEKKNISIDVKIDHSDVSLSFDSDLILKVLEIVIDNALKYSHKDSIVIIKDSIQNSKYTLSIMDEGVGFSKDALENLFKFFVSDDIMYHDVGYGLGLATAKIIMDIHKNSILISNKEKGAVVNLVFPIN